MNGLFVLNVETLAVFPLYDEGINGGGNVDPLAKVALFDVLSCSSVGGFVALANGFGVRAAVVAPNGFVVAKSIEQRARRENERSASLLTSRIGNQLLQIDESTECITEKTLWCFTCS